MLQSPGLYIHLPFCSQICPYCDFSVLIGDSSDQRSYLASLVDELSYCTPQPWPEFAGLPSMAPFDTIYLGGGTPSLHTAHDLACLIDELRYHLDIDPEVWVALEANPEDVTPQNLAAWRELGISFLSLGIQALRDDRLRFLGRRHDAATAKRSIDQAREAGFATLSIDLIFGLPDETAAEWQEELQRAITLEPDHISCYQLTIEPQTPFGFRQQRGELAELTSDRQAEQFLISHRILAEAGFAAYEVSNFAKSVAHQSQHNQKYWHHTPYLGLGLSAHSMANSWRWWNERKIKPYRARLDSRQRPILGTERLSTEQTRLEKLMLGLRTPEGVDFESLPGDTEQLWHLAQDALTRLDDEGLIQIVARRVRPTLAGLAVADSLARLLSEPLH